MDPVLLAERLEANAGVFRHLLAGVAPAQARWKPAPEKWSLLEVVNHLADEEREDFRRRLDLTLHHPGEAWPPIDPPRWAVEREYNSRELAPSLDDFLRERRASVEWLRGMERLDGEAAYRHPVFGPITAQTLAASWLAHDLIHVRQVTRLHYEYLRESLGAEALDYAGPW